jgi:hypothetical protein
MSQYRAGANAIIAVANLLSIRLNSAVAKLLRNDVRSVLFEDFGNHLQIKLAKRIQQRGEARDLNAYDFPNQTTKQRRWFSAREFAVYEFKRCLSGGHINEDRKRQSVARLPQYVR